MLKSTLIKILARGNLFLGIIFRRNRVINRAGIKTILINRADRLGDAAVSLPLLLELNKRFEVTVLTSQYNDFILKGFLKTKVFLVQPLPFVESVKMIFKNLFLSRQKRKNNRQPKYDLYLDLMGIRGVNVFLKVKEQNLCRYYAGFNLGIWNSLLDYAARGNPALFSKMHILESYQELIRDSLSIELDIPDHVDLSAKMVKSGDFNIESPYLLVNIAGGDKFRGPTPRMFAEILNQLDFKGKIVVMDDLGQPDVNEFKKHIKRENIIYLEEDHSLWELLYISKNSLLYIGSDSGITQLLSEPVNCCIFFATGSSVAWKPYSKNPYLKRVNGKLIVEEAKNSLGLMKKIIYSPAWCRPCFDMGCRGCYCIKNIDIEMAAEEINSCFGYNI